MSNNCKTQKKHNKKHPPPQIWTNIQRMGEHYTTLRYEMHNTKIWDKCILYIFRKFIYIYMYIYIYVYICCLYKQVFHISMALFTITEHRIHNIEAGYHTVILEQATSHCLNQWWPSSLTHIGGTRGRCVNDHDEWINSIKGWYDTTIWFRCIYEAYITHFDPLPVTK